MFKVGDKVLINSPDKSYHGQIGTIEKIIFDNCFYRVGLGKEKILIGIKLLERIDNMDLSERLSEVIKENQNLKQQLSEQNIKLNKIQADVRREQGVSDGEFREALNYCMTKSKKDCESIWGAYSLEDVFCFNPLSEFVNKYKEYKDKQNEIKVGDEIAPNNNENVKAIVIYIGDYSCEAWLLRNGGIGMYSISHTKIKDWHKTGRHFDEVDTIISALRESD